MEIKVFVLTHLHPRVRVRINTIATRRFLITKILLLRPTKFSWVLISTNPHLNIYSALWKILYAIKFELSTDFFIVKLSQSFNLPLHFAYLNFKGSYNSPVYVQCPILLTFLNSVQYIPSINIMQVIYLLTVNCLSNIPQCHYRYST